MSGPIDHGTPEKPTLGDIMDPEHDRGLPHDRREHGGEPTHLDDDALQRAVEGDREAAAEDQ